MKIDGERNGCLIMRDGESLRVALRVLLMIIVVSNKTLTTLSETTIELLVTSTVAETDESEAPKTKPLMSMIVTLKPVVLAFLMA